MAYIPVNKPTIIKNLNPSASRSFKQAPLGAYDAYYNNQQNAISGTERAIHGAVAMADKIAQAFAGKVQQDEDIQANNGYQLDKGVFQADMQKQISETSDPKQWTEVFKRGYMDFQNQVYDKYSGKASKNQMLKFNQDLVGIYTQGLKHWTGQGIRQIRADAIASSNASLKTISNSDMDVANKMASIDQILNTLEDSGHITPEAKQAMRDGWEKESYVNDAIKRVRYDPDYNDWKDNPIFGKIEKDAIKSAQDHRKREIEIQEHKANQEAYKKASDEISTDEFIEKGGYSSMADLKMQHPNITDTQARKLFDASESYINSYQKSKLIAERATPSYFKNLYNMVQSIDSDNIASYKSVYDALANTPSSVKKIINKLITDKTNSKTEINRIPSDIKTAYNDWQDKIKKDMKHMKRTTPEREDFYNFAPPSISRGKWTDNLKIKIFSPNDQFYNPRTGKPYTEDELQVLANERNNNFYRLLNDTRELALKDGMTLENFTKEANDLYLKYKNGETIDRLNQKISGGAFTPFFVKWGDTIKQITAKEWNSAVKIGKEKELLKMRIQK